MVGTETLGSQKAKHRCRQPRNLVATDVRANKSTLPVRGELLYVINEDVCIINSATLVTT